MLISLIGVGKALGGVSENTVRKVLREGNIPIVRLGRRVLVHREDLTAYLATQKAPMAPKPAPAR